MTQYDDSPKPNVAVGILLLILAVVVGFFWFNGAIDPTDPPNPSNESVYYTAATGAVVVYDAALATRYGEAATKLRSGELHDLNEANQWLNSVIPNDRIEAFSHFGQQIDQIPEGDVNAAADALDEASQGFRRAADAVK